MASFITVKRLRLLLSEAMFDNALVYIGPETQLYIGPNDATMTHEVDFRSEMVVQRDRAWLPNPQDGKAMAIEGPKKDGND